MGSNYFLDWRQLLFNCCVYLEIKDNTTIMRLLNHFKNTLFLITFCFTTSAFAQTEVVKVNFPISGLMKVQKNEQNEPKRYNYIHFAEDTYALMLDQERLFTFQALAFTNDEYVLKQVSAGTTLMDENSDPTNIRLKINSMGGNKYELTFIFPNRTEKIILIKE